MRFLLEVTEAVSSVWGANRVGIKLSPSNTLNDIHNTDPKALFSYAIAALNSFCLGYLHWMEASDADIRYAGKGIPVADFRPFYSVTLIANGGYGREKGDESDRPHLKELIMVSSVRRDGINRVCTKINLWLASCEL
ncbi:hypothetical protein Ava_3232 [Trichormus variabilis ATCC 29413]|uniref:NADH:flavin oxidoreductase/NADH oxidase N-terminal domain-containing protein n=1 Tax=Trichormus variabilis (strain ATCC 29413 / PCC 7937) TaxID=240292 RepID=Q3M846_TRIV2|nr:MULTISPECIES: hypothetical protein [Nostocaceae]ABA22840.1 hypothetical protein Ava_3232 [Trichormus variabilis ATCC 29413]